MIVEGLITVSGVTDPRRVEFVEAEPNPAPPELPVAFEGDASSPPAPVGG